MARNIFKFTQSGTDTIQLFTGAGSAALTSADIGVTVQAYNSDLDNVVTNYAPATTTVGANMAFKEGTNNGTNKVTVQTPAVLAGDVVATLPSATGTILTSADIGSSVQAYSATLDTLSSTTAAGLALMDDVSASAQRTTMGVAIGIDIQPYMSVSADTCISNAVTIATRVGIITTESLTTAFGSAQAIVITNPNVTANSAVIFTWHGGTNPYPVAFFYTAGAGTVTVNVGGVTAGGISGTVIFDMVVLT